MPKPKGIDVEALTKAINDLVKLSTSHERSEFASVLISNVKKNLPRSEWDEVLKNIFSSKLIHKLSQFSQIDTLMSYLEKGNYFENSFGEDIDVDAIVAFSFGESSKVNEQLAKIIDNTKVRNINKHVQWEIGNFLDSKEDVNKIVLNKDESYMTTKNVVERLKIRPKESKSLMVVAQSWHAPRCIYWCNQMGYKVTSGKFLNQFAPKDPQPWVRDTLSWILKESITTKIDLKTYNSNNISKRHRI